MLREFVRDDESGMSFVFDVTAVAEYASDIAEMADVAGKEEIMGCVAVLVEFDGKFAREHS